MATYKSRLTRRERKKYLEIAEDIQSRGGQIEIPEEWHDPVDQLRIAIAGPPASGIYQLAAGVVIYVVRTKLVAELGLILQDFEINAAWDPGVYPCGPAGGTTYRFSSGLQFEWDEVLNHRIENYLRFRRGDICEGWLLAMGLNPVPEEYGAGRPAPLELVLLDQFSRRHIATADFVVERSAKRVTSVPRLSHSLFEPDAATVAEKPVIADEPNIVPRRASDDSR